MEVEKDAINNEIDKLGRLIAKFGKLSGNDQFENRGPSTTNFKGIFDKKSKHLLETSSEVYKQALQLPDSDRPRRYMLYADVFGELKLLLDDIYMYFPLLPADEDLNFETYRGWLDTFGLLVREVDVTFTYLAYWGLVYRLTIIIDDGIKVGVPDDLEIKRYESLVMRLKTMGKDRNYYADFYRIFLLIDEKSRGILRQFKLYESHKERYADINKNWIHIVDGVVLITIFGLAVPLYMLQPLRIGLFDELTVSIAVAFFLFIGIILTAYGTWNYLFGKGNTRLS